MQSLTQKARRVKPAPQGAASRARGESGRPKGALAGDRSTRAGQDTARLRKAGASGPVAQLVRARP